MLCTAFPDAHYTLEDIIAEGDQGAARWTLRGMHQGEFMGIAPMGKQLMMTGINISRSAGGKIEEI
jgi:predicted ester cyclase